MNRRSIFGLLAAAPMVAKSKLSLADVKEAGLPLDYPMSAISTGAEYLESPLEALINHERRLLDAEIDRKMMSMNTSIPPHIASKKSWSMAFKVSESRKEYELIMQARHNLWDNTFMENLLKLKGLL
jgi:hypothetical protein